MKKLLTTLFFLWGLLAGLQAQSASSLKWSEICSGKMPAEWYGSEEAQQIADKLLKYQKNSGGWMKNIEFHKADDTGGKSEHSCLDNGATTMEMRFLAKVYQKTKVAKYQESFQKALDMIFTAEKSVGGWSQYWPLTGNDSYQDYITFNDDLMTNVMKMLKDITSNKGDFADITDEANRAKCQASFDKAIECIINCQVDDNGTKAAWCAQHDPDDFLPMEGRPHELPSISGYESANLLSYLMTLENPSEALQNTIHTAVAWLDAHKYRDNAAVEDFTNASGEADRHIVDKQGSAVWGRFIQLGGETGKANYQKFLNKLSSRGKSRSYTQNGKTYTYTEWELAKKTYNPDNAYQPIFAIYDDQLQHLYYRFMYSYEDTPDSVDWKGCTVPTSLNALRRKNYQFMGSWPYRVIKSEYPAWVKRISGDVSGNTTYVITKNDEHIGGTITEIDGITVTFDPSVTDWRSGGSGNDAQTVDGIDLTGYYTQSDKTNKAPINIATTKSGTLTIIFGGGISKAINMTEGENGLTGTVLSTGATVENGQAPSPAISQWDGIKYELEANKTYVFSCSGTKWRLAALRYISSTTAITTLPATAIKTGKFYNLQGIEVTTPTNGLYIHNGKKIIIQ